MAGERASARRIHARQTTRAPRLAPQGPSTEKGNASMSIQRDPLSQHIQASYDPDSPEAIASAKRSRSIQRAERAAALQLAFDSDEEWFYTLLLKFLKDDPQAVGVWTAEFGEKVAKRSADRAFASGAVKHYRKTH
jgi:hypothetical protein